MKKLFQLLCFYQTTHQQVELPNSPSSKENRDSSEAKAQNFAQHVAVEKHKSLNVKIRNHI